MEVLLTRLTNCSLNLKKSLAYKFLLFVILRNLCSTYYTVMIYECNTCFCLFIYYLFIFQLEIPKQLFDQNVFNAWMLLFLNVLERPVPLEGQPADPEVRKTWGWWKVKKWTVHILNRLYTR